MQAQKGGLPIEPNTRACGVYLFASEEEKELTREKARRYKKWYGS
jgi:hypothetical protein